MIYIAYYTTADDARISSPAANSKTYSISKALAKNGIDVEILSTCTVAKSGRFICGRKFNVADKVVCKQYALFNTNFGPLRRLQYYFANIRVFFELLCKAKKDENVLFYHAIERSFPVLLAKKIKKFRLILEVEEIYADARELDKRYIEEEQKCLNSADAYIFPTKLLNKAVNVNNKPYCIIHGTYETEPVLEEQLNDKVHIVYAGTLDTTKGGAEAAVKASLHLTKRYHVHVLGFGSDEEINKIKKMIEVTQNQTDCCVTYDGCLLGEEFTRFLQRCHIGLSTQNPNGDFNDTSFPSKILTYMANGLNVVTAKIPVVETSKVNAYMNYYDRQTPEDIAQAIMQIDCNAVVDNRKAIEKLNIKFSQEIMNVLE